MKKITRKLQIGVIGSADPKEYKGRGGASKKVNRLAEEIGLLLGKARAVVITGGKGGIMESTAKGVKQAGGITLGVIKGEKRLTSNRFTDIEIVTGMAFDGLDELLLVLACDALIVLGGGAGTLQEIAIAYRNRKPLVVLENTKGWSQKLCGKYLDERKVVRIQSAKTPPKAVSLALKLARKNLSHHSQPL